MVNLVLLIYVSDFPKIKTFFETCTMMLQVEEIMNFKKFFKRYATQCTSAKSCLSPRDWLCQRVSREFQAEVCVTAEA